MMKISKPKTRDTLSLLRGVSAKDSAIVQSGFLRPAVCPSCDGVMDDMISGVGCMQLGSPPSCPRLEPQNEKLVR
jgi:hypothetical protein